MSLGNRAMAGLVLALACGGAGMGSVAFGQGARVPWSEMEKFFLLPEQYRGNQMIEGPRQRRYWDLISMGSEHMR
jgi:hypothetical protein